MVTVKESQSTLHREVVADDDADAWRWERSRDGVPIRLVTMPGEVRYSGPGCVELLGAREVVVFLGWDEHRGRPTVASVSAHGLVGGLTFARWAATLPAAPLEWDAIAALTEAHVLADDQGRPDASGTPTTLVGLALAVVPGYIGGLQRGSKVPRAQVDQAQDARDYLEVVDQLEGARGVYPVLAERWGTTEAAARKRVQRAADAGYLTAAQGDRRAVRGRGPMLGEA